MIRRLIFCPLELYSIVQLFRTHQDLLILPQTPPALSQLTTMKRFEHLRVTGAVEPPTHGEKLVENRPE